MTKRTTTKAAKSESALAEIDWTATFIEAVNAPGSLGNTYCRFYNYSFLNQIRLMMQGVAEPVATYRRWSELGFQVQKGSKAKVVLAPLMVTKRDSTGKPILSKTTGKTQQVLVGFRDSRTVFGFSDTDGEELPAITLPTWEMDVALKALKVSREKFKMADGNCQGYSYQNAKGENKIAVNPAAKFPAKTLLHELAHIVLGHCAALAKGDQSHRGVSEFEAESVAYLLAKELELEDWAPAESRKYIENWLAHDGHDPEGTNGSAFDDKNVSRIFAAANKILVAGRPAVEVEPPTKAPAKKARAARK
jgi:antirestriction protein ArdC